MQLKFFNLPRDIRQRIYGVNNNEKLESLKLRSDYFKKLLINELSSLNEEFSIQYEFNNTITYVNSYIFKAFRRMRFQVAVSNMYSKKNRDWYNKHDKMLDNASNDLIQYNYMKEKTDIGVELEQKEERKKRENNITNLINSNNNTMVIVDLDDY